MLKFTKAQCSQFNKMENDGFVRDIARNLKKIYPGVNEPDETLIIRLGKALDYANILPLKVINVKRDFLMLEAFYPGFYLKPEVDKWLRTPNGYSADQRVEDYKHVMVNRERREL
ncbi:hypothetical protein [Kosakonia sp. YIM B13611]|uniref:hypothetical protein n=1 Tax=unclassified Kosakonia TaxID=2632876 RepID=UPI003697B852